MFKKFAFAATVFGTLLSGCAAVTTTDTGSIPITRNFEAVSMGWTGEDSQTVFLYLARDRGGMTEVCGAIFTEGTNSARVLEPRVKERVMLRANRTLVLNSLRHFNRVSPSGSNQRANCALTSVPWNPAWTENPPEIDSRNLTFEV